LLKENIDNIRRVALPLQVDDVYTTIHGDTVLIFFYSDAEEAFFGAHVDKAFGFMDPCKVFFYAASGDPLFGTDKKNILNLLVSRDHYTFERGIPVFSEA